MRLILKNNVTEEDLFGFASEEDCSVVALIDQDLEEDRPYEIVWKYLTVDAQFHYIVDHAMGIRYILVDGEDALKVSQSICADLDVMMRDEVVAMWEAAAADTEQKVIAIRHVGVAAPQTFDVEFFRVFRQALQDEAADVRRETLFAICYAPWREFVTLVEESAKSDSSADVRERAAIVLESFNKLGTV